MVIFNNDTLKEAVKEWCNDIDAARSKHGHRIIWQKYSDVLFTNLPYDDLTEATDEDEDNFDNTRYFGRCEGNVDTITFNGGISGFYFTGNYYADYMEVVPEE